MHHVFRSWISALIFLVTLAATLPPAFAQDAKSPENFCPQCTASWPWRELTPAKAIAAAQRRKPALIEEEKNFLSYLDIFCMNITQTGGTANFRRIFLPQMRSVSARSDELFELLWTLPYCEPRLIGGTSSTLVHLAMENPTDRGPYLVALNKYLQDKGQGAAFTRIINAPDSRGQTPLDYMIYMLGNREYIPEEEAPLNDVYQFLCASGAVFRTSNRSCGPDRLAVTAR